MRSRQTPECSTSWSLPACHLCAAYFNWSVCAAVATGNVRCGFATSGRIAGVRRGRRSQSTLVKPAISACEYFNALLVVAEVAGSRCRLCACHSPQVGPTRES